jgi:hypothetical protein
MSLSTSGQISFSQINSALRISNGNLGIGTTAPGFLLDVNGTIKGTNYTGGNMSLSGNITSGTIIVNGSVSANSYTGGNMQLSGNITTNSLYSKNGISVNYNTGINIRDHSNPKVIEVVSANNNDQTRIYAPGNQAAGNTPKIIVQANGNVGISSTAPGEALEVGGNMRVGNSTSANYIAFSGVQGDGPRQGDHTYIGERLYNGNDFSELLLFKGNDPAVTSGPDRIRLLAPEIDFETATGPFSEAVTAGTTRMTILNNGNISIGTTRASAKLNIGGGIDLDNGSTINAYGTGPFHITPLFTSNDYIQMYDELRLGNSATNTIFRETSATMGSTVVRDQLTLAANNQPIVRFNRSGSGRFDYEMLLDATTADLIFRGGANGTGASLTETLRINQGVVSAGSVNMANTITAGTLMVNSNVNRAMNYTWLNNTGNTGTVTSNPTNAYSIYCVAKVACTEFNAYSDERIKKNIQDINDASALEIIRQIQPKRYNYIDVATKGEEPVWGFIAQQVESVLDYSVNKVDEYIPNIYNKASVENCTDGSILTLSTGTTSVLDITKSPEEKIQVRLYLDQEVDGVKEVYVKEIINGTQIKIEEILDTSVKEVFIYGQKVKDFHALNKDAIFTVSVAALQEVDRQLQDTKISLIDEQIEINTLNQQIQDITSRLITANL